MLLLSALGGLALNSIQLHVCVFNLSAYLEYSLLTAVFISELSMWHQW